MSFETSGKRTSVSASNGYANKRLRISHNNDSVASFADTPAEYNIQILHLLDLDDFVKATQVSHGTRPVQSQPALVSERLQTRKCSHLEGRTTGSNIRVIRFLHHILCANPFGSSA
jgi:hypothetical protein